ncbi:flavodoxin domain-containing protein [Dethiosulfatarculus sandiegensis]|uniref:Flavodoxin domain-containing protein n=1 Tax=Dethiosulfatarculus sandiegensis TaxID=1429043 RepID=A0A0D2JFH5_9BACT|nr:flavodoxin domain-containing protein [Dethiosulfatarculus sandiegensis]KIX14461.1 hypothetical protein X474_10245 [Dethiosulfatarculus sandiegensis]
MQRKTLLCFAGKTGTTETAARIITDHLRQDGECCVCLPASEVKSLTEFQRVIIASPLYYGKCPEEITEFMQKNKEPLAGLEVMVFFICLRLAQSEEVLPYDLYVDPQLKEPLKPLSKMGMMEKSHSLSYYLEPLKDLLFVINPQSLAFFKGNLLFKALDFKSRMVMRLMCFLMKQVSEGEFLNKAELHRWSSSQLKDEK